MKEKTGRKPSFSDLYGYFCGMMPLGKSNDFYDWMLGGIPDLGSIKGEIQLYNQSGSG